MWDEPLSSPGTILERSAWTHAGQTFSAQVPLSLRGVWTRDHGMRRCWGCQFNKSGRCQSDDLQTGVFQGCSDVRPEIRQVRRIIWVSRPTGGES